MQPGGSDHLDQGIETEQFEKLPGGCRAAERFAIDENATASDALDREVSPERTLLSSGSALRKERPRVFELGIEY
jgi:hypothetical protein